MVFKKQYIYYEKTRDIFLRSVRQNTEKGSIFFGVTCYGREKLLFPDSFSILGLVRSTFSLYNVLEKIESKDYKGMLVILEESSTLTMNRVAI